MINTNQTFKVIGIINHYNDRAPHCETIPIGIFNSNNQFKKISQKETEDIFLPNGKIFIPDIANAYKNHDIIEFFTRTPIEQKLYENKDIYSLDSRKEIKTHAPKVILLSAISIDKDKCEYNLIDKSIDLKDIDVFLYDQNKKILYDKVNYNKTIGIRAIKGKSIKGINYDLLNDENFIYKKGPLIYLTDNFLPNFSQVEEIDTLDLSTLQQKIECFKKSLFELNKFSSKEIQDLGHLLNIAKRTEYTPLSKLQKQRICSSIDYLDKIVFSDRELKNLFTTDSNIGSYLIEKAKQAKRTAIESEIEKEKIELLKKLESLNKEITIKQKEVAEIEKQKLKLIDEKIIIEKETIKLEQNKETIYETIKAMMKCNLNTEAQKSLQQDIYEEVTDLPINEYLDSDFDFTLIEKKLKYILINKFSLIPSISYVYTLANSLGNSKVLNLSVEYDWLHFSDFINHGLIEFIKEANKNKKTFFFLHFDNLNIIPTNCGFNSIFKVINKEKPYLEGTKLNFPSNLFLTATILPTKKETDIGHPLPDNLKNLIKGIESPTNNIPLNFERQKELIDSKYLFSDELINNLKKEVNLDYDTISEYYEY